MSYRKDDGKHLVSQSFDQEGAFGEWVGGQESVRFSISMMIVPRLGLGADFRFLLFSHGRADLLRYPVWNGLHGPISERGAT